MTQEELGERAGVSYKFIGDVERGRGNPTVDWLDAVTLGLGVTIKDLIVDEEPRPVPYWPLASHDYSAVREARDSLETILRRYGEPADEESTKGSYVRPRRSRTKRV